jgi:glutathione S-transferase
MLTLYYHPGWCSLAPHIALRETALPFALTPVAMDGDRRTPDGRAIEDINPKGYVPALELEGGEVLTEGPAILQYIADLAPGAGLAPPAGTLARVRLQEWLNFLVSELHKSISPLFYPEYGAAAHAIVRARLAQRLAYVESVLTARDYLLEGGYSVADAHLFTVARWLPGVGVDMAAYPALAAHHARVGARPAVQAALAAEGHAGH